MDRQEYERYCQAVKSYGTIRLIMLLLIIASAIDSIIIFFGFNFPFGIFFNTMFTYLGTVLSEVLGSNGNATAGTTCFIFGIIAGLGIIAMHLILYFASKKSKTAFLVNFWLFIVDTAVLLVFTFINWFYISNLILHGVIIYFFIKGKTAAKSLDDDFDTSVATTEDDITEIFNLLNAKKED